MVGPRLPATHSGTNFPNKYHLAKYCKLSESCEDYARCNISVCNLIIFTKYIHVCIINGEISFKDIMGFP